MGASPGGNSAASSISSANRTLRALGSAVDMTATVAHGRREADSSVRLSNTRMTGQPGRGRRRWPTTAQWARSCTSAIQFAARTRSCTPDTMVSRASPPTRAAALPRRTSDGDRGLRGMGAAGTAVRGGRESSAGSRGIFLAHVLDAWPADAVTGRHLLLGNGDVRLALRRGDRGLSLYRNAIGDECVYVESGSGVDGDLLRRAGGGRGRLRDPADLDDPPVGAVRRRRRRAAASCS